jgi:hypothetical protein
MVLSRKYDMFMDAIRVLSLRTSKLDGGKASVLYKKGSSLFQVGSGSGRNSSFPAMR